MTLLTTQGFTALHYAVLYDIEASALKKLLDIAAKAEIHRTWSEAWSNGGVRVSPLHLAYLYRRDAIVKELLAFRWDPTETIKELVQPDRESTSTFVDLMPDDSLLFDAYDQSIVELGFARAATAESQMIHKPPTPNSTGGVDELLSSKEETHAAKPSEGKMLCGNGDCIPVALPPPSQYVETSEARYSKVMHVAAQLTRQKRTRDLDLVPWEYFVMDSDPHPKPTFIPTDWDVSGAAN